MGSFSLVLFDIERRKSFLFLAFLIVDGCFYRQALCKVKKMVSWLQVGVHPTVGFLPNDHLRSQIGFATRRTFGLVSIRALYQSRDKKTLLANAAKRPNRKNENASKQSVSSRYLVTNFSSHCLKKPSTSLVNEKA